MPIGDHSIERRTGIKPADLWRNRRMAARARLDQTDGQGRRIIARHADRDGRHTGSIKDRLAAAFRTQTATRRCIAVFAAIAVVLSRRRGFAATIHRRGRMSGATARVCSRAAGFVRAVLMAAEELELPVRAQAAGARHSGKGRQRNHSPDEKSRKWRARTVHSAGKKIPQSARYQPAYFSILSLGAKKRRDRFFDPLRLALAFRTDLAQASSISAFASAKRPRPITTGF